MNSLGEFEENEILSPAKGRRRVLRDLQYTYEAMMSTLETIERSENVGIMFMLGHDDIDILKQIHPELRMYENITTMDTDDLYVRGFMQLYDALFDRLKQVASKVKSMTDLAKAGQLMQPLYILNNFIKNEEHEMNFLNDFLYRLMTTNTILKVRAPREQNENLFQWLKSSKDFVRMHIMRLLRKMLNLMVENINNAKLAELDVVSVYTSFHGNPQYADPGNYNALSHYPAHWGKVPAVQTRDYVSLPGGGKGSSTLRNWIMKNYGKDSGTVRTIQHTRGVTQSSAPRGTSTQEGGRGTRVSSREIGL
jgi:hypothetical protein